MPEEAESRQETVKGSCERSEAHSYLASCGQQRTQMTSPAKEEPFFPPSRRVETKYGVIEGRRLIHEGCRQVDAFQGIPYAAPPVGELRFKLPQEHQPWTGVKETKKFGFRGIQKDSHTHYEIGTSEDNLTLNVFTPTWQPPPDQKGFAVLVFIHGGAFVSDSAVKYGDINVCKYLVTKDVVVVTLQYRLGYLGFWTSGDDACPNNLALHDMAFALKWIHENIEFFNGDKSNVTVMGQSAGGASVDLLSISPVSRDYFHKVIPMAGTANSFWAVCDEPMRRCRKKARAVGVDDCGVSHQWIGKLRELKADAFAAGMEDGPTIAPRLDNDFLPKSVKELRKEAPAKPRIIGCCEYEGLIQPVPKSSVLDAIHDVLCQLLSEQNFPRTSHQKHREILDTLIDVHQEHSWEDWAKVLVELNGDQFINLGVQLAVVECLETSSAPVYMYSFNYFDPHLYGPIAKEMPLPGATHCLDVSFVFGVGIIFPFELDENDLHVLETTTRYWTNFAKYGDPNGRRGEHSEDLPHWLPVTKEHPQRHMTIDLKSQMCLKFKDGRPMRLVEMLRHPEPTEHR